MSENRLPDYLDHIQQAATDARSFVEGMAKDDFLADKRTQQAVIMAIIISSPTHTAFGSQHTLTHYWKLRHENHRH
ncbi:hypothetical protein C6P91_12120 [Burkholderia multivorans]|nr:hypothetical protein [Burkholderia multivorans]PRE05650.1 hypothetical protein C6P91_12120 [Burkholderia multivorans]